MKKKKLRKLLKELLKNREGFCPGDVVVFDPTKFNPEYWDNLSEEEKIAYYGQYGYGQEHKFFIYLCDIRPSDHCILVNLHTRELLVMVHPDEFRKATEDEF
jgi:hypothetical protein